MKTKLNLLNYLHKQLKKFVATPNDQIKQEKTISYITQIVKLFVEQKLGDNLDVLHSFIKIKKGVQPELADYFHIQLESGYLILSIDKNIIFKESIEKNLLSIINDIIEDEYNTDK